MPRERFADLETLAPEIVGRIDRAVTRAMVGVGKDPDTHATVTIEFRVRFHHQTSEVVTEYTLRSQSGDSKSRCAGMVRDAQMVLPGTGLMSDRDPEEG